MPTTPVRREKRLVERQRKKIDKQFVLSQRKSCSKIMRTFIPEKNKYYTNNLIYFIDKLSDKSALEIIKKLPQHLSPVILEYVQLNITNNLQLHKFQTLCKTPIEPQITRLLDTIPNDKLITFVEKSGFSKYDKLYYIHNTTLNHALYEHCVRFNTKFKSHDLNDSEGYRWIFQYTCYHITCRAFENAKKSQSPSNIKLAIHLYNTILYVSNKFGTRVVE